MTTLVITGSSRKKSQSEGKAKDIYRGTLFTLVRRLCEKKNYDYVIISMKKGLLFPDDIITPYASYGTRSLAKENLAKLMGSQYPKMVGSIVEKLKTILPKYEKVIVIAGRVYDDVLEQVWDHRFSRIESRGYGDLCRILSDMAKR